MLLALIAATLAGSCRGTDNTPVIGRPCNPALGGTDCPDGFVCRHPEIINADRAVCCPLGDYPPGPCGSNISSGTDGAVPSPTSPSDASSFDASPEVGPESGTGTCNDAYCPSTGVGVACCVTSIGPCGTDTGSGCTPIDYSEPGPPPCGDLAPEGQLLVGGLHYPTLVPGSPPLIASHDETWCGSPMCTWPCGGSSTETVSLADFDGKTTPVQFSSMADEIVLTSTDVFWVTSGGSWGSTIEREPRGGGPAVTVRGVGWIGPLAPDADQLYWAESDFTCVQGSPPYCAWCSSAPVVLMSTPLATGTPLSSIQKMPDYVGELVAGTSTLFFTMSGGLLQSMPKAGGSIVAAPFDGIVKHLAIDADTVHFAHEGTLPAADDDGGTNADAGALDGSADAEADAPVDALDGPSDGAPGAPPGDWAIGRWSQGGGPVEWIATGLDAVGAITVDATHVYWVEDADCGSVWRVAKDGGVPEVVARYQPSPTSILVDDTKVYWALAGTFTDSYIGGNTNPDGEVRWVAKVP